MPGGFGQQRRAAVGHQRLIREFEAPAEAELVRLAMPRRVYTQSHADYVVEVFEEIVTQREQLRGLRIVQQPAQLRHFTAQFAPL